jgi:hypothetical protein
MAHRIIHIQPEAPHKPALGAPCNGCGVCCLDEPCPLGVLLSRKTTGACHVVRWNAKALRYECGAISDTAGVLGPRWAWGAGLFRRLARRWVAAGVGCDAALSTHDPAAPTD